MQDACKIAIDKDAAIIDKALGIPQQVIQRKINDYNRLFDFPKYENDVKEIIQAKNRTEIKSESLIYLLRYLFVLEYGKQRGENWYDAHPCLKQCLQRRKK